MPARRSRPARAAKPAPAQEPRGERLQKVLAAAGLASRRECEELITQGRVEVDGRVVSELGSRVDPNRQQIRVDGVTLRRPKRLYYMVNKPVGVVCTNRDPAGRPRVVDLVGSDERLFTVGRLDRTSEGLILVTNDGELSQRLTHPRYGIDKVYRVRVAGNPSPELLRKLRRGVHLAEGPAQAVSVRVKTRHPQSTDLEMTLDEGRNREIRRVMARLGHKVLQLRRIALGPLRLGDLPLGACRTLTSSEVRQLERAVKAGESGGRGGKHRSAPKKSASKSGAGRGPRSGQRTPAKTSKTGSRRTGSVLADGYEAPPQGAKRKRAKRKRSQDRSRGGRR